MSETKVDVVPEDEMNDDEIDIIDDPKAQLVGIPGEMIDSWLATYGVVFRIWFLGEQYVYRNLSYPEYKTLRKTVREKYSEDVETGDEVFKEEIQKKCVVWPENYAARLADNKPTPLPGGIPFIMSDYILASSGFSDQIIPDVIRKNDNA